MYGSAKIISLKQAARVASGLRSRGKKVATTNGCFDILHRGHMALLKAARSKGDAVMVGLNSDRSVKKYKGDKRPIRSQADRARLLLDLPWVDYVVIFHDKTSVAFVKAVKPHFHINDSTYGKNCIEKGPVEENGGRIVVVKKVPCRSTTQVINTIIDTYCRKGH